MALDEPHRFSSNELRYSQRLVTQEQLRATQEELATKIRELQIYEQNYIQLKKELARWKKKFEYIFRENELLSLETAKLDAAHKQIAFLQQEVKFKEEEGEALRGLVSALEASNKKARASRLDSASRLAQKKDLPAAAVNGAQLLEQTAARAAASDDKSAQGGDTNEEQWAKVQADHAAEKERLQGDISSLKSENSMLLKDLDRKEKSINLLEDQLAAQKDRIESLQQSLKDEQNTQMDRLKEKQDLIVDLEQQIQAMRLRKHSGAARGVDPDIGFGPTHRLRTSLSSAGVGQEAEDHGSDDGEDLPDTPPGTPPPITSGLLPREDPSLDYILKDWEDNRRLRAAASTEYDATRMDEFLSKLPYESKEGASRVLLEALAADDSEAFEESQVVIRNVTPEGRKELEEFVVPALKAHRSIRVTYATLERRTLVTDVRITLETRDESCTGSAEVDKRFGQDHAFLGPSADDVSKLVPHTPRVLTTQNRAAYVSKPVASKDGPDDTSGLQRQQSAEEIEAQCTHESDEHQSHTNDSLLPGGILGGGRKWRVPSVPNGLSGKTKKLVGTMVTTAKQRVAAKFTNNKFVHEGTSCQFCKMTPIVGSRYSCSTCVGFDLCEGCYSLGGHGLENSDDLFHRVQEIVLTRCPRLTTEMDLLELMRFEICRSNFRKFNFCLNWLADIINGKSSRELQARALEIPNIRRDVRKQFVPLLMTVCSDREDIEVKTEWELESDNSAQVRSVVKGSVSQGDGQFLETLRIWVADQYRTTSPFVERNLLKYREGAIAEEDEEQQSGDDRSSAAASRASGEHHSESDEGVRSMTSRTGVLEHAKTEEF